MTWHPLELDSDPDEAEHRGDPAELIDAADLVAVILARPGWHADALCQEYRALPWVGGLGEVTAPAVEMMRRVCSRCLVADECTEFAEAYGADLEGLWAGTTARERRKARPGR